MRIDWWTLALQTVNVLVLIWILSRFFFRPVANIIAKRQEEAQQRLAEIGAARKQIEDREAELEHARAELKAENEKSVAEAEKLAETRGAAVLDKARAAAEKMKADLEASVEHERAETERALEDDAAKLAVEIARRLLTRLPPEGLTHAFIASLCDKIRALPPNVRSALTAGAARGEPIEAITAVPLVEDDTAQLRRALVDALGTEPALNFRIDPALIAGIELHSPSALIRNSWREDLDHIRQELSHGDNRP